MINSNQTTYSLFRDKVKEHKEFYHDFEIPSIPLRSPFWNIQGAGKIPIPKGWQKFTLEDSISYWEQEEIKIKTQDQVRNIGILTGEVSNLTVVDIDTDDDGLTKWNELIKIYGEPNTPKVRTGSGGLHYYFKFNRDLKSTTRCGGVGIDIRNNGGQVVAPPSFHKRCEELYKWIGEDITQKETIEIPEWLLEFLTSKVPKTKSSTKKEPKKIKTENIKDVFENQLSLSKNLNLVCNLLPELSESRADSYTTWRDVIFFARGYANHLNEDEADQVYEATLAFSMLSEKHDDDVFEKQWNLSNSGVAQIGMGSFIYWCKEDCLDLLKKYNTAHLTKNQSFDNSDEYTLADYINEVSKSYSTVGDMFDDFVSKIKKCAVVIMDKNNTVIFKQKNFNGEIVYDTLPLQSLTKTYSHTNATLIGDDEDLKISIFTPLLLRLECLTYKSYGLNPDISREKDPDVFNLWTGYRARYREEYEDDCYDMSKPILDHIKEVLAGGDKECYSYILSYLAHIINPSKGKSCKTKIAMIFQGSQGCGKDIIFSEFFIPFIIGRKYSLNVESLGGVVRPFNGHLKDVIFTLMDELNTEQARFLSMWDTFKSLITNPTITINAKGVEMYEYPDYNNYVATTNHVFSTHIEEGDRRFSVFKCSDKYKGNFQYFNKLAESFNKKMGDAFFTFLTMFSNQLYDNKFMTCCMNSENEFIQLVDVRKIINTQIKEDMMENSMPKHLLFVKEFTSDEESSYYYKKGNTKYQTNIPFTLDDLYKRYEAWFSENKFSGKALNKRAFARELKDCKEFEYKQIGKGEYRGRRAYVVVEK